MVRSIARHRQTGHGGGVLNGGEAGARWRHDAQRGIGVIGRHRRDGHDGIDAAAERNQWPTGLGFVGDRRGGGRIGAFHPHAAQIEAVAVRELRQPVDVEGAQELPLHRRRRQQAQVEQGGGRRLVVGHAGQQVEEAHGGHHRGILPVAVAGEREAFREGMAAGCVAAVHDRARRIDGESVIAEPVGWWHAKGEERPGDPGLPMLRRSPPHPDVNGRGGRGGRSARRAVGRGR